MKGYESYDNRRGATQAPRSGQILVANPLLIDRHFNRAVVLILSSTAENAHCGLNINMPANFRIGDLDLETNLPKDMPIFYGGPCGCDRLFMLHDVPNLIPGSLQIAPGIYLSSDLAQLSAVAPYMDNVYRHVRFCIGYAGWEPNQLDEEIANGAWVVSTAPSAKQVFENPPQEMWQHQVDRLGEKYQSWGLMPTLVELN